MNKRYDSYKDSGIEWLNELPSHWEISKVKFIFNIQKGKTPKNLLDKIDENAQVYLAMDYLRGEPKQTFFVSNEENVVIVDENETLLLWDGSNAGEFIKSKKGVLSSTMAIIKSQIVENQFQWYSFKSFETVLKDSCNGMGIPHVDGKFFKGSAFAVPPIDEQTAIANFLDQKTAQIDDLIAKKERLIQLLEEERTAIINQAVTKGLDPSVPMKDSGIDGLNFIPSSWKLLKFKMFAPILTCGVASTPEYVDESVGVPFLSAQNVKNNQMRLDNYRHISIDLHNSLTKNRKPQNGDILVTRVGAGIGDACIVDCDFEFSVYVSLTHIRVDESIVNNKFIMYFFSTDYCKYLNSQGTVTGGGVGNLNVNNVERYKVPIPPLDEQNEIVVFITRKLSEIDLLVLKTQKEIELLKEYKTALISEVVTGKVDVSTKLNASVSTKLNASVRNEKLN